MELGVKINRVEIDRKAPFKSVKEAVSMFGEKVLAAEVYTSKLKVGPESYEYEDEHEGSFRSVTVNETEELEETRQSLLKAREQSAVLERSLSSLKQELETTKRELVRLKKKENGCGKQPAIDTDDEAEDVKFAQEKTEVTYEFQKKRYVSFAAPLSVASQDVVVPRGEAEAEAVLKRHPSLRKKKKKPLLPLIFRGIFSRKRASSDDAINL